jgi:hypothetical protein
MLDFRKLVMDASQPILSNQNAKQDNGDVSENFWYDARSRDLIAGTRGENLRRIENRTGALLRFSDDRSRLPYEFALQISGSRTAVTQAAGEISRIIDENEKLWHCRNCHHDSYDYYNTQRCWGCRHDRCPFCRLSGTGQNKHVAREWEELQNVIHHVIFREYLRYNKSLEEVLRVILDEFPQVNLPMSVLERKVKEWGFPEKRSRLDELQESGLDQFIAPSSPQIENLGAPTSLPTEQPPNIFISRTISQDVTPADQNSKLFIARTISQDLTGSDASHNKHLLCALRDRPSGLKFRSKRLFREDIGSGVGKRRRM